VLEFVHIDFLSALLEKKVPPDVVHPVGLCLSSCTVILSVLFLAMSLNCDFVMTPLS
jgi:hypothetical protein